MKTVLLSVKPVYADRILSGEKRYEFRRGRFASEVDEVLIYATSPSKKIIGYFRVEDIHEGMPMVLWNKCFRHAGVEEEAFFAYFAECNRAYAIQVDAARKFATAVDPYTIWPDFSPPQSFMYVDRKDAKALKTLGRRRLEAKTKEYARQIVGAVRGYPGWQIECSPREA